MRKGIKKRKNQAQCQGQINIKSGKFDGIMRQDDLYYVREQQYKNGKEHGLKRIINSNGDYQIKSYKNGELCGWEIFYDKNDQIKDKKFYH